MKELKKRFILRSRLADIFLIVLTDVVDTSNKLIADDIVTSDNFFAGANESMRIRDEVSSPVSTTRGIIYHW